MLGRLGLAGAVLLANLASPTATPDVRGKWQVTITHANQEIDGKAWLRQKGERVSGWVGPSENDPIPVEGRIEENLLTLKTYPQRGRTVEFAKCELTVEGDKMIGTIDTNKGTIEFLRTKEW